MRFIPALLLVGLLAAPAASAHHDVFETCTPFGGGLVGELGNTAHTAACGVYHTATVFALDEAPAFVEATVNGACRLLIGQNCV